RLCLARTEPAQPLPPCYWRNERMSVRSVAVALAAALAFGATAGAAHAQQPVETYSNFRWAHVSPAACIADARHAIAATVAGFALGDIATGDDTWHAEAN